MKQVLIKKRKYSYKDVFRAIGLLFMHFMFFYAYIGITLLLHTLTGSTFLINIDSLSWGLLYPMSVGPLVNFSLQIIYAETGSTTTRFLMWLHTLVNMILIPVIIFVAA